MPRKYRDPLVMRYLQGESLERIAIALAVSSLVVKGRLQRGKQELRERLALRGVAGLSLAALDRANKFWSSGDSSKHQRSN